MDYKLITRISISKFCRLINILEIWNKEYTIGNNIIYLSITLRSYFSIFTFYLFKNNKKSFFNNFINHVLINIEKNGYKVLIYDTVAHCYVIIDHILFYNIVSIFYILKLLK